MHIFPTLVDHFAQHRDVLLEQKDVPLFDGQSATQYSVKLVPERKDRTDLKDLFSFCVNAMKNDDREIKEEVKCLAELKINMKRFYDRHTYKVSGLATRIIYSLGWLFGVQYAVDFYQRNEAIDSLHQEMGQLIEQRKKNILLQLNKTFAQSRFFRGGLSKPLFSCFFFF